MDVEVVGNKNKSTVNQRIYTNKYTKVLTHMCIYIYMHI